MSSRGAEEEEGKGTGNSRPQQRRQPEGAKEEHELEFASRTRETPEDGREVKIDGGGDKKKTTTTTVAYSEPAAGESPGREQQR